MADYSDLKRRAQEIRDEAKAGANTANRVGVALEGIVNALEDENLRATGKENDLGDDIQRLQDETEDLQSMRDAIDSLGTSKADKTETEDLRKSKQDKLRLYEENVLEGIASIEVSHDGFDENGEMIVHDDKIVVGEENCVLLSSDDMFNGVTSTLKVSADTGVTVLSPNGEIEDIVKAIKGNTNAIATLNGTGEGSVSKKVTDKIAEIVAGAPADLDTLKEIADYIASDKTNAAEINNTLDRHTSEITSLQNNKQDKLVNYAEEPGGKTTIQYPNGTARVDVSNVRAALWANDDKVAIAADANGTRMLYQKTAEDGSIEHRDEISIGKHNENSATHITLTSKSTTEEAGEKITTTSTIQVNPDGISMTSPNGYIEDVVKEINDKAPKVGYAPDLKVNFAKELVGRGEATEEVIGGIRPTGEISIGDGNATIERIKGESVVWNQLSNNGGANEETNGLSFTNLGNGTWKVNGTAESSYNQYVATAVTMLTPSHKYLLYGCPPGGSQSTYYLYDRYYIRYRDIGKGYFFTAADTQLHFKAAIYVNAGVTITNLVFKPHLHDLTQMFGAGNEPTTIEDFEARKPLNVTNEYNEGTIVSYDGSALKSVGFNAYNGTYAKVIGGEVYHATGTTSISFAKELGGDTTAITLDSNNKFIPTEDGYVYAEGTNIVIHLTHSYTPEHVDEYEEDVHVLPDVKSILDANGNQLFPYGLLSAGSVHDEITATKAIKRVGAITLTGEENWSLNSINNNGIANFRLSLQHRKSTNGLCDRFLYDTNGIENVTREGFHFTAGINLYIRINASTADSVAELKEWLKNNHTTVYYELAEPIEVDLPEPLNMTYEAWDFGTEELVYDTPTTPLNADIVYQFNAVDRIRENTTKNTDLENRIAALEAMITQLTAQTTNDGGTSNEQM